LQNSKRGFPDARKGALPMSAESKNKSRTWIWIALCLIGLLFSIPTHAEIYKCVDQNGNVTFTTKPEPGCRLLPESVDQKAKAPSAPAASQSERKSPAKTLKATSCGCTTKDGYIACQKKEWLDDVTAFISQKDHASLQAYLDAKKCLIMKGGLRVTVTEWPGILRGTTGFIYQGIKFWTYREGIDYNP
jgi:hypothetical protein